MDEASGADFHPTELQRRVLEGGPRSINFMAGQRSGRRYATEMFIVTTAANEHEAELALEDLRTRGIALLSSDGRRIEPRSGGARFTVCRFDEEKK